MSDCFTKRDSLSLKGIAILLMMFHHCFCTASKPLYEYTISFYPFKEQSIIYLADMSKICVSLFAFVTGYGLYLSIKDYQKNNVKWVITRYVKTFSGYWFIWILSAICSQVINKRWTYVFFRENGIIDGLAGSLIDFLGLATLFGTNTLNGTWWYMSAAFVFIVCMPWIVQKENNIILLLVGIIIFPRILPGGIIFPGGNSVYAFFTPYIFGIIFAKYNLMEWIISRSNKKLRGVFEFFLLLLFIFAYGRLNTNLFWEIKWGMMPLVVIVFIKDNILNLRIPCIIFEFLGRHSMNVFLIHTFIRLYYLKDLVYTQHHFIFVIIFLLVISLIVSFVIEVMKNLLKYDRFCNWIFQLIDKF